jgi:hypothetical protein
MWRVIRFALLWLLAVALPFQGAVAATMIACGPNHHGAAAVVPQKTGHDRQADVAPTSVGHDHAQHQHGMAHHSKAAATADHGSHASGVVASDDSQQGAQPQKVANSKCSVCATCCTAAALPSSAISFDSPPLADRVHFFFASHAAVFMTDGPDRPPRTSLA